MKYHDRTCIFCVRLNLIGQCPTWTISFRSIAAILLSIFSPCTTFGAVYLRYFLLSRHFGSTRNCKASFLRGKILCTFELQRAIHAEFVSLCFIIYAAHLFCADGFFFSFMQIFNYSQTKFVVIVSVLLDFLIRFFCVWSFFFVWLFKCSSWRTG